MKRIVFALALLTLIIACGTSQADFPRRRSCNIVAPCFTPTVCHTPVVHHEAAIVVPGVTTIIQQSVPTFLFQYNPLPAFPPAAYGQQYQQSAAFNMPPQAPPQSGLALTDAQMDRIATMVAQKLSGAAVTQNTLLQAPPMLEETPAAPAQMSQGIVNDIGTKCASCHMAGTTTKGGLAIFDQQRNFNPTKGGVPYNQPEKLWQRAQSGEMPPSAATDPRTRLNDESIAFLRSAIGQ